MKTLTLIVILLFSFTSSNAQEIKSKELKTEISNIVSIEKDKLPEDMNKTEFVILSFKVNENGKINVLDMNYSNEIIKKMLIGKLSNAIIKNKFISSKIHYYKILFKKL